MGISLGEVYEFNSNRVIYNVYFFSKSVVSLYLAVGLLHYFIEYIDNKQFSALIWMGLLSGAILINNSRTGLACFAVCAGLYCIRNARKIVSSISAAAVLILICAVGLYIVQLMLASRSSLEGFSDDNGRFETITEALRLLPDYVFFGIGGSAKDYILSSMGVSVHNFFVAYLIQFGAFGGLAVNLLLLSPISDLKNKHWYSLFCVILGGMLFANWHIRNDCDRHHLQQKKLSSDYRICDCLYCQYCGQYPAGACFRGRWRRHLHRTVAYRILCNAHNPVEPLLPHEVGPGKLSCHYGYVSRLCTVQHILQLWHCCCAGIYGCSCGTDCGLSGCDLGRLAVE